MKIEQKAEFMPITITLETKEEALAVWDAVRAETNLIAFAPNIKGHITLSSLSNWFSNNAQL